MRVLMIRNAQSATRLSKAALYSTSSKRICRSSYPAITSTTTTSTGNTNKSRQQRNCQFETTVNNITTTTKIMGSSPLAIYSRRFSSSSASLSSSIEDFQEQGIMDSEGLLQFETLHEAQVNASIVFAENELFGTFQPKEKGGNDNFKYITYKEYGEKVDHCRLVLKNLGVQEYDKIGIISNNRWEWATIAAAAYSLNCTLVPMYEAQLPSDWSYILNDSGCSALFCATQDIFDRVQEQVLPQSPSVKATLCLDSDSNEPYAFATLMKEAASSFSDDESLIIKPSIDDLANLVYTSGTTGKPKGVELTHANTVSNVKGVRCQVDDIHDFLRQSDRSLAFLPWAHSYGQTCELWVSVAHGCSMGICRGVPFILEDLQLVKPTTLFAVPTLYKRVYDGVNNLIGNSPPLRQKLMKKSLALGRRQFESSNGIGNPMGMLEKMQYNALNSIVLSKIRDRFGGNLRHAFVAGAACPSEIIDFMDDIGIPVCEGYGLTETSPIITINTPYDRMAGSVGKTLQDVNVVIMGEDGNPLPPGEEGEICCYGPNVMRGYYKNKKATDEVISLAPDGLSRLFHTGDLGRLSSNGWLKVTGRLKEQYKLENGKYVCPTPIEEAIGMSRFIMQVVVCGSNRPHNIALIVPDLIALRTELKIDDSVSDEDLANDERVQTLLNEEIKCNCERIKKFEVPKAWSMVAPFTAANNMLTPKMSIRRHMVIREYDDIIGQLYGDEPIAAATSTSNNATQEDNIAA